MSLTVRFWGTRGSLPVALSGAQALDKVALALLAADGRRFADVDQARAFARTLPFALARGYGGNTSCVQVERPGSADAAEYLLCDFGSGARVFGNAALARHGASTPMRFHVLMSHLHWDHIMGFPFFAPAYIAGQHIRIYGCHAQLEAAFRRQHGAPSFPVEFDQLPARIEFVTLEPGQDYDIAGLRVCAKRQLHSGDSYGWRIEHAGKRLIYSTDSEHKLDSSAEAQGFVEFFRDADLVIFDAMYSLADAVSVKEDWGHSSNVVGVELCQLARARRLALFHHEPIFGDERIAQIEAETRRLEEITRGDAPPLQVVAAYDGLEIAL